VLHISLLSARQCQSQSFITTDGQSASLSWCQAPIWNPRPIYLLLSSITFRQLRIWWRRAPSLARGRVCSFQFPICNAFTQNLKANFVPDSKHHGSITATNRLTLRSEIFATTAVFWTLSIVLLVIITSLPATGFCLRFHVITHGESIQSPKCLKKNRKMDTSKRTLIVLLCHGHKLLEINAVYYEIHKKHNVWAKFCLLRASGLSVP
jgi:hypothetical protein